ncbi:MAG: hypothetical protein R3F17_00710 [Planctomycetota bacterium]
MLELLFRLGVRNSHVARELGIPDESSVAGIKFRALKRLAALVQGPAARGGVAEEIGQALDEGRLDLDLQGTWNRVGASCPHRYWWARAAAGLIDDETREALDFHRERGGCEPCQATWEDCQAQDEDLAGLVERLQASTIVYLRGRTGS